MSDEEGKAGACGGARNRNKRERSAGSQPPSKKPTTKKQSTAPPESQGLTPAALGGSGQGGSVLRRSERIAEQDREPPPKSCPFDVACCKPGARISYEFSSDDEKRPARPRAAPILTVPHPEYQPQLSVEEGATTPHRIPPGPRFLINEAEVDPEWGGDGTVRQPAARGYQRGRQRGRRP